MKQPTARLASLCLLGALILAACPPEAAPDDGPEQGTETGACYPNGTCNDDLTCASNVCVSLPGEGEGEG